MLMVWPNVSMFLFGHWLYHIIFASTGNPAIVIERVRACTRTATYLERISKRHKDGQGHSGLRASVRAVKSIAELHFCTITLATYCHIAICCSARRGCGQRPLHGPEVLQPLRALTTPT